MSLARIASRARARARATFSSSSSALLLVRNSNCNPVLSGFQIRSLAFESRRPKYRLGSATAGGVNTAASGLKAAAAAAAAPRQASRSFTLSLRTPQARQEQEQASSATAEMQVDAAGGAAKLIDGNTIAKWVFVFRSYRLPCADLLLPYPLFCPPASLAAMLLLRSIDTLVSP